MSQAERSFLAKYILNGKFQEAHFARMSQVTCMRRYPRTYARTPVHAYVNAYIHTHAPQYVNIQTSVKLARCMGCRFVPGVVGVACASARDSPDCMFLTISRAKRLLRRRRQMMATKMTTTMTTSMRKTTTKTTMPTTTTKTPATPAKQNDEDDNGDDDENDGDSDDDEKDEEKDDGDDVIFRGCLRRNDHF